MRGDPSRYRLPSMCIAVLLMAAFVGPPAFGATLSGSAIPTGFRAQSLTWVSASRGWMLGVAPCGPATCTTVVGTTNGGGTWNTVGTLRAPVTEESHLGVTELRFANRLDGWAFGPSLHITSDGGATWGRETIPGAGRAVLALAADTKVAYAVVTPCGLNQPLDRCTQPATLWRSSPPGADWRKSALALPVTKLATLALHGRVAYLVIPRFTGDPDLFEVKVGGAGWEPRPNPCSKVQDETLSGVAAISRSRVALMCIGNPGFSKSVKRVFRSNDTALTTRSAGTAPLYGIQAQLAATPDGTLLIASWSDGSFLYRNGGGRSWTTPVALGDGGLGWNDIVFTTNDVGFVVYGPAQYPGNHPGQLVTTHDGGVTWAPA